MKKLISSIAVISLLLGGCAGMDRKSNSQGVPEKMTANEDKGQDFQPPAEQSAIDYAKKHQINEL